MNRLSKLLFVVIAVAATIAELKAGSPPQGEDATPVPSDPTTVSLTVNGGERSGRYAAGSQIVVSADAAPIGTSFSGWAGDVQILANPGASTTTAIVPYAAVSIRATYSTSPAADAQPSAGP
jgi:List-Bact-rpt repeat protein